MTPELIVDAKPAPGDQSDGGGTGMIRFAPHQRPATVRGGERPRLCRRRRGDPEHPEKLAQA